MFITAVLWPGDRHVPQILLDQGLIVEIIKQAVEYLVIGLAIFQSETEFTKEDLVRKDSLRNLWTSRQDYRGARS